MDEDVPFEPERAVDRLYDVDGRFWLGADSRRDAIYAFDADGSLVRTIRAGRAR